MTLSLLRQFLCTLWKFDPDWDDNLDKIRKVVQVHADTPEPRDNEILDDNLVVRMEYESEKNNEEENKNIVCKDNVNNVKKLRKLSKQLNDTTDILVIDTGG